MTSIEEQIIATAEAKAVLEWKREHGECDHPHLVETIDREFPWCYHCGLEMVE